MLQGMLVSAARTVGTAAHIVVMLVIELVATMLVYTYLNLYHLSTFGYLVRLSRSVLDVLTGQLEYWLPVKANTAYATLIGELGPKSILLLILGLVTATVVRGIAARALHLHEEQLDRIVEIEQLEPLALKRAGVDLSARVVRHQLFAFAAHHALAIVEECT